MQGDNIAKQSNTRPDFGWESASLVISLPSAIISTATVFDINCEAQRCHHDIILIGSMDDGIVGEFPDECLGPEDLPPVPSAPGTSSALATATAQGELSSLKSILGGGDGAQASETSLALSVAIRYGHTSIVSFLMSRGVVPREADIVNAIRLSSYEILQAFLRGGLDINQTTSDGSPPLIAYVITGTIVLIAF